MEEQINALISSLQNLKEWLVEHADLVYRVEVARADLESTNSQLAGAREQLESANAGLSAAQIQAQQEHNTDIFRKQAVLKGLQDKISDAEARAAEAETRANSASQRHDAILASLESLKSRFAS